MTFRMRDVVLLLCGGFSSNHRTSIIATQNVANLMQKGGIDFAIISLTRSKKFYLLNHSELDIFKEFNDINMMNCQEVQLFISDGLKFVVGSRFLKYDVVFSLISQHDEGAIMLQSIVECTNTRYIGSNLGNTLGLYNRDIMYRILSTFGIQSKKYIILDQNTEYEEVDAIFGSGLVVARSIKCEVSHLFYAFDNYNDFKRLKSLIIEKSPKLCLEKKYNNWKELDVVLHIIGTEVTIINMSYVESEIRAIGNIIYPHSDIPYKVLSYQPKLSMNLLEQLKNNIQIICRTYKFYDTAQIRFFVDEEENLYISDVYAMPYFTGEWCFWRYDKTLIFVEDLIKNASCKKSFINDNSAFQHLPMC
ncbi:D-alanine--D-alanine ligase [Candidatus Fokinia crypta]|uniref:D-alanine--D-alanine ligase n=1 Tax=Candidatus Fokinia crypta TaxID=1920990 RepID=A0ABZ0UUK8_9RICK|nr:hypothetical protein [Candidatus Fokinia cryptica]WPX97760.1 D-alanine--D-alanine ligase [Candidatus Fokinia cryptica]